MFIGSALAIKNLHRVNLVFNDKLRSRSKKGAEDIERAREKACADAV